VTWVAPNATWWAQRPTTPRETRWYRGYQPRQLRGDRGSATVELAVCLPALMVFLATGLAALGAVRLQIECVDAAREAARAAARGEPVVSRVDGAAITISTEGDLVRATVRMHLDPFGVGLPGFDITSTSVAALEPS
jgi:TadE-like protein